MLVGFHTRLKALGINDIHIFTTTHRCSSLTDRFFLKTPGIGNEAFPAAPSPGFYIMSPKINIWQIQHRRQKYACRALTALLPLKALESRDQNTRYQPINGFSAATSQKLGMNTRLIEPAKPGVDGFRVAQIPPETRAINLDTFRKLTRIFQGKGTNNTVQTLFGPDEAGTPMPDPTNPRSPTPAGVKDLLSPKTKHEPPKPIEKDHSSWWFNTIGIQAPALRGFGFGAQTDASDNDLHWNRLADVDQVILIRLPTRGTPVSGRASP